MEGSMKLYNLAIVGLGVMGSNLLLNLESKGFTGVAYDAQPNQIAKFLSGPGAGKQIVGATGWPDLAAKVERPRRVFILVPAGNPVDAVIEELLRVLEPGDVIVDCGNSHYRDTERREQRVASAGLHFTGMGVSGGEEGARQGPSLMPGGPRQGYAQLAPLLERIAAQVEDGPCCTYMGPGGAGHYVKMVHNGIEYGDMQLIAEAYDLLKRVGGLTYPELADVFDAWNQGELGSFLIQISARIFMQPDTLGPGLLLDAISDSASMKGTGSWTVQDAMERGVPIPTITAAVDARLMSARLSERRYAAQFAGNVSSHDASLSKAAWADSIRAALFCAKTCSYAQGMALLSQASREFKWELPLAEIARIWKGGCIIRAKFLKSIQEAYRSNADLPNLLVDPSFREALSAQTGAWRQVVATGLQHGIPLPAFSASLAYYDAYHTARLPQNLVQAQRDLFGAHTYERLDRPGTFHTKWK
jgi:6-phosphogluconate dehydrogenase